MMYLSANEKTVSLNLHRYNVVEAKRRLALSRSNASAILNADANAGVGHRERHVYELVGVARHYNATVVGRYTLYKLNPWLESAWFQPLDRDQMKKNRFQSLLSNASRTAISYTAVSMPAILVPELLRDDPAAALEAWEAGRARREAREWASEEEEEERRKLRKQRKKSRVKNEEHFWPIDGWCDDAIHPRAQYDEEPQHFSHWMAQGLTHAVQMADVQAVAGGVHSCRIQSDPALVKAAGDPTLAPEM
jgi:hypothetical protein